MIYLKLFWAFVRVAFFSIGGTYSFLPMMEREIVDNYQWLERGDFLNIMGIVRMLPGAISVQFATYVGYKVAGLMGAICAILGNTLPPALFILPALYLYNKHKDIIWLKNGFDMVKVAISALIIIVVLKTIDYKLIINPKGLIILVATILLFLLTKIHPAFIIAGAYMFGVLYGRI